MRFTSRNPLLVQQMYPYRCRKCGHEECQTRYVWARDHPAFCPSDGWAMQRLIALPQLITDRFANRYENQMLKPGTSNTDRLEFLRGSEKRNLDSWKPSYDHVDESVGGSPV